FRHYTNIGRQIQQVSNTLPYQGLVFHQNNAEDLPRSAVSSHQAIPRKGSQMSNPKPRARFDSMVNRPPSSSTRSRMPRSPLPGFTVSVPHPSSFMVTAIPPLSGRTSIHTLQADECRIEL